MVKYFCRSAAGEPIRGPLTAKELKMLAVEGWLQSTSLVSLDGRKWHRADKVRGLTFSDDDSDVVTLYPAEPADWIEPTQPRKPPPGAILSTTPESPNGPSFIAEQSNLANLGDDPFAFVDEELPAPRPVQDAPEQKPKSEAANVILNGLAFVLCIPVGVTVGVGARMLLFPNAGGALSSGSAVFCCYVAYQVLKSVFGVK